MQTSDAEDSQELKLTKKWQEEARKQTLETLPAFLQKLATHEHDYGTICRAIAAAAVGAAWAIEHSPHGGITGFQASCVTWDFLEHWGSIKFPAAIVRYEDMLFPQYAEKFNSITPETWEHLQAKARENLAQPREHAHPAVAAHWQTVADGVVPFGYTVRA